MRNGEKVEKLIFLAKAVAQVPKPIPAESQHGRSKKSSNIQRG